MTRPLTIAATLLTTATLYAYPPETTSFYPVCPIHALTGLLCPGCGATRALSALLHAHLTQAWHLNPLIIALLPLALAYATLILIKNHPPKIPPPLIYTLLAITTIFTITRN
ncbi:DUF2752 domain-containing protein [Granulicella tundricola]|uniref:DUF2752 domain-containing protein n=1 Tax=Granulicella tundricola (strain ATCC BAA-1859 / DSM 23138 / MP5ACTX9) TaxID=1198114 RepID=E8WXY0_GRATM|nr:DUF2752 domain-containing protein [Granulicella tundricola]ADW67519.1 hypothetical protein AciX9_0447 [Granulicella tundricola MP5ACTX9]